MDDDELKQQRFRFEKFLFVLLALWVAGFAAARIWWGYYASSQLQAQIGKVRQQGQPLHWREALPPPVPDDRNAALIYDRIPEDQGYKKIVALRCKVPNSVGSTDDVQAIREVTSAKFRLEHPELVKEIVASSAEVLALVRQARNLPSFRPVINETQSPYEILLPTLKSYQMTSMILHAVAADAHAAGRDAEAIEYLRDTAAMARHMGENKMLLPQLVAMAVAGQVFGTAETILPDLKIGPAPAAGREQVQALIAELPAVCRNQRLAESFMFERGTGVYGTEALKEGKLNAGEFDTPTTALSSFWLSRRMLSPMWDLQEANVLAQWEPKIKALQKGLAPPASSIFPTRDDIIFRTAHYFDIMMMPTLDRAVTLLYRAQAKARMASVALAIKLYELDNGRMPDDLGDLVPRYIPAVPDDPFFPGRALGYLPQDKHPMLYTIGQDRVDDGGRCSFVDSRNGAVNEEKLDTPMFLRGDRMAAMEDQLGPPPATQPGPGYGPGLAPPPGYGPGLGPPPEPESQPATSSPAHTPAGANP